MMLINYTKINFEQIIIYYFLKISNLNNNNGNLKLPVKILNNDRNKFTINLIFKLQLNYRIKYI